MKKIKLFLPGMSILLSIVSGVVLVGAAIQCVPVYAAESNTIPNYRLAISPTQQRFDTFEPGKTYSDFFAVKNTGKKTFNFEISFTPYSILDEHYSIDYDLVTRYSEIVDWLDVDIRKGTVDPDQEVIINYTVKVPDNAHGGAQQGVIMVTMTDIDEETGNIEAVRRLGYIIYGNVSGDITQTAKIIENKIPGFLFQAPIYAESVVENTGNIYSRAEYTLQVFPLFSNEEIYTNEEEPSKEIIFPETKRYNKIEWEGSPQLGIFKVRQTVKLFDVVSTEEKLVIICPIWFLFICLLVLFIIIFSIINHVRNRNEER